MARIGTGYDVHRLVTGRKLMIGGVDIPFEKGLSGHSDADVLLHAICDALLGAAGLGDIGRHFPDTAPIYKGISSLMLLEEVRRLLAEAGFRVNNSMRPLWRKSRRWRRYPCHDHEHLRGDQDRPVRGQCEGNDDRGTRFCGKGRGDSGVCCDLDQKGGMSHVETSSSYSDADGFCNDGPCSG